MSRCGECKLGCNESGVFYCEENLGYEQCIDRLQDALYSADRPQGKWIITKQDNGHKWTHRKCSECGKGIIEPFGVSGMNYCPNCGVRMKGADDDSDNI